MRRLLLLAVLPLVCAARAEGAARGNWAAGLVELYGLGDGPGLVVPRTALRLPAEEEGGPDEGGGGVAAALARHLEEHLEEHAHHRVALTCIDASAAAPGAPGVEEFECAPAARPGALAAALAAALAEARAHGAWVLRFGLYLLLRAAHSLVGEVILISVLSAE